MRARIATAAVLASIVMLVAPAKAQDCVVFDGVFQHCRDGSTPPPPDLTPQPEPEPEPQPQPQPQPAPQPEPEPQPAPAPQPEPQANPGHRPGAVARILVLMNNERTGRGLPQLALRGDVSAIAAPHSEAMAAKGTIWHNDAYFTDAVKKRLDARLLGENVARNTDIDDAHRRLMNSPGHRANILDGRFTVLGMAVYDDGWGNLYVTQSFVQPNAAAPKRAAAGTEKPRSAPSAPAAPTTTAPAPSTTTTEPGPEPAPVVLSAAPEADVAPVRSTEEPVPGPNPILLAFVAMLALGCVAAYTLRSKLHFFVPVADR